MPGAVWALLSDSLRQYHFEAVESVPPFGTPPVSPHEGRSGKAISVIYEQCVTNERVLTTPE